MITIFKYKLEDYSGFQEIEMKYGAVILSAQLQDRSICIWAEVDPKEKNALRSFEVFGTGWEIPCDMGIDRIYLNTVQDEELVWHVYERIN